MLFRSYEKQKMPITLIPIEKTLDPGETIVPAPAVNTMANIVAINETSVPDSDGAGIATFVIGAIVVYIVLKILFRFWLWILGLGLCVVFLKLI